MARRALVLPLLPPRPRRRRPTQAAARPQALPQVRGGHGGCLIVVLRFRR
uniref:Uncharacterized protein n=1 Tax=Setaria italica TaxID=4555 RepID=K4AP80_SETIT